MEITVARYDTKAALPGGEPGPWSDPVEIKLRCA